MQPMRSITFQYPRTVLHRDRLRGVEGGEQNLDWNPAVNNFSDR
jgi:hypothetical protein